MFNKLSFKITALFALIILIYMMFIIFLALPKIKQYVFDSEIRAAKAELQKVASVVNSKSKVLETFSEMTLQNHKNRIKDIAQVGNNILDRYYAKYRQGELSLERAKELAFSEINTIRYGEDDYFFILDKKGVLVQHPDKRFLGQSLYDRADERGKLFAQELMRKAYEKGDAYTRYWWLKNKQNEIIEKIAYTKHFKPWDIYISSGLYIDDIQKEINLQKQNIVKSLKNVLATMKIVKTGYIFIISSDNTMITHPNKALENKDFSDIYPLNQQLSRALNTKETIEYFKNKLKTKKEKLAWVEYNDFFGWYMVATVPKNELYYAAKDINYTILSISFIVLSFLFVIATMFVKKLIYPAELLSKDALEIQKGNLSIRNNIKSNDELGVLATQFNYMVSTIEDNVKNLEEKVLLRTQELNDKLYFDDLTKLKNKFALMEDLKGQESSTLMILDIESFDDINELYSYHVGNVVLIDYTKFLQRFCQDKSYELYRLFGNTYALRDKEDLINLNKYEADINELVEGTKRYKANVEDLNLKIDIDVTLGAAIFQDNPLRKANIALKYAKKNHKRFFVYSTLLDENERIENIVLWREQLKDAIENNKIVPFYQPILNRDKEIIKFETLMRMKKVSTKEESYISPFIFLDVAVRTKQYARLSEITIRKALSAALYEEYSISINLSYADIEDIKIIDLLDEFFNKNSPDLCSRVIFEILESDHITDYEIFEDFIFKYRKLGIRFAIDDFGTGYSNFTHILAIRPDYIKIDGSLIKNIDTDNDSLQLVKSIIRFCQELDIKTIAEFVHNEEVFNIIHELGVDEFQGFYFSPPVKDIKECKLLNQ